MKYKLSKTDFKFIIIQLIYLDYKLVIKYLEFWTHELFKKKSMHELNLRTLKIGKQSYVSRSFLEIEKNHFEHLFSFKNKSVKH